MDSWVDGKPWTQQRARDLQSSFNLERDDQSDIHIKDICSHCRRNLGGTPLYIFRGMGTVVVMQTERQTSSEKFKACLYRDYMMLSRANQRIFHMKNIVDDGILGIVE